MLNTLVRQDSDLLLVSEPMGGKHWGENCRSNPQIIELRFPRLSGGRGQSNPKSAWTWGKRSAEIGSCLISHPRPIPVLERDGVLLYILVVSLQGELWKLKVMLWMQGSFFLSFAAVFKGWGYTGWCYDGWTGLRYIESDWLTLEWPALHYIILRNKYCNSIHFVSIHSL